jgi:uncharacterized protein YlxW (UPF0749 family)
VKLSFGRLLLVGLLLALLGVMVGVEFRVHPGGAALGPDRLGQMATILLATERRNDRLAAEVLRLRSELIAEERGATQYRALLAELEAARAEAGLTQETGPGVTVTLTEPPGTSTTSVLAIHDTDLLILLNELRAAGATALAINGQRVVATTEVRQTGSVFSINDTPAAPPFTIVALGDPKTLAAALALQGGIVDMLESFGVGVKVTEGRHLTVPPYVGGP